MDTQRGEAAFRRPAAFSAPSRLAVAALLFCFLGAAAFTYRPALPGRKISLPADHASHPDFKIEWWYYTGHLSGESGRRYGYQVTFFRFGLRDRQSVESKDHPVLFTDLYMAHFALSDVQERKFSFRERINRGYGGKAGAATDRYFVWNESWKVEGSGTEHRIEVDDRETKLELKLVPLKPPVLHGENGFSRKGEGEGRASHYYSLTRMRTEGRLTIDGRTEKVTGESWMDHEFGTNQLGENQVGWDWFSIQLDDQTELMLYLIRRKDGSADPYSSGTRVDAKGRTRHLALGEYRIEVLDHWKSPKSGATYPIRWRVTVPSEQMELEISPLFREQELVTARSTRVTYWEGAVEIRGKVRGKIASGRGYVEMTGYAGKLSL
ncbi:MAG TPA: lipocalin-like domain-containing protein [candidate division Zixibacteria bacterium]|nr:lipocalin-like domain-containing protein [candidate division Zixibacteria bacterium]